MFSKFYDEEIIPNVKFFPWKHLDAPDLLQDFVHLTKRFGTETSFKFYNHYGSENELKKFTKFWGSPTSETKPLESCENLYWFPQFLNEVCPLKTDYNVEWKRYLLNKNSEEIKKSLISKERFTFYTPKIVKCIFNLCKMFKQPPEVRYLAVDIFDRFLVQHFFKVSATFEKMERDGLHTWEAIVERMLSQSPLRILTSVQLAMKYSWSCNIITVSNIQEAMEFLASDEQYSRRSILKSEARVYQHLDYNMANKTAFTYLEMFFDDFHTHELFSLEIPLRDFFTTCIHVLDVAIIFHQRIYNTLQETNQNISDDIPIKSPTTAPLKANFVLLAASVIFASSCLEDPNVDTFKVRLGILCSIGECKKSDIEALGREILNVIQSL